MVGLLERLRKEWHVIKGATFSFVIVCAIVIGVLWSGFRGIYKSKISDAEHRANNWQNDAAYWKEQAEKPKPASASPQADSQSAQKPTNHTQEQKSKKGGRDTPTIAQDCGGGDCAASVGQQGGITAGKIEYNAPPKRNLTDAQKQGITAYLRTVPPSVKFIVGSVYGSSDANNYALQFFPLFDGRHSQNQPVPNIHTGFDEKWTGVYVATISDNDTTAPYRDALAGQLTQLGIEAHKANDPKMEPGAVEVLVGFNREETKQP
ncbi:MAG TPA: hypothetical protein VEG64_02785 [Candidatus Sulfotelmatobacter sp.]|nr:hypothetical protein [Candidatus Sulfotelmatobacter sp.]